MKELITRIEELAVQASRDARQIETLQGLLRASQSSLEDELQDAIESKKKINELASENARLIVSECGHKKTAVEVSEQYADYKENAERWKKALNEAITKRDIELRAVDVAKRAHEKELAEQREEIRKLRAEVPLESTREGLKNAVAKLQEVTTDRDRVLNELAAIVAEANKTGRCGGDPVALIKQGQTDLDALTHFERDNARLDALVSKLQGEVHTQKTTALESKAGPSIETLSAELSVRYAEIAELHKWALVLIENPSFAKNAPEHTRNYRDIVERINSRPQLDLTATLPTVDWQGVARNLEQTIAGLNAKVAELEAQAGKIGYVAKREHEEAVTAARENGIHKGESLSGFIWRQCEGLRKSQAENAPLTKLFVVLCKQRGNLNEEIIYRAVDEASDAIKQLTA